MILKKFPWAEICATAIERSSEDSLGSSFDCVAQLLEELFPQTKEEIKVLVSSFLKSFITNHLLLDKLYSKAFLRELKREEVEEYLINQEGPVTSSLLSVLSNLLKVHIILFVRKPGSEECLEFGNPDWPLQVSFLRVKGRLFKIRLPEELKSFTSCSQLSSSSSTRQGWGALSPSNLNFTSALLSKNDEEPNLKTLMTYLVPPISFPIDSLSLEAQEEEGFEREVSFRHKQNSRTSAKRQKKPRRSSMNGNQLRPLPLIHKQFKKMIIEEEQSFREGIIKFYSPSKEYGFILSKGQEIFLHKDDLLKANISPHDFSLHGQIRQRKVEFRLIKYQGKSSVHYKAIDIKFI